MAWGGEPETVTKSQISMKRRQSTSGFPVYLRGAAYPAVFLDFGGTVERTVGWACVEGKRRMGASGRFFFPSGSHPRGH